MTKRAEIGERRLQGKNHQDLPASTEARREAGNSSPSESPQGAYLADTLVSDFRLPELRAIFLLFEDTQFVVLGCGSSRKLI